MEKYIAKQGIYRVHNLTNDCSYIGHSNDIEGRYRSHMKKLNMNEHGNSFLQKDWNKYKSESFYLEILLELEDMKIATEVERAFILKYYPIGIYNISDPTLEYHKNNEQVDYYKNKNDNITADYTILEIVDIFKNSFSEQADKLKLAVGESNYVAKEQLDNEFIKRLSQPLSEDSRVRYALHKLYNSFNLVVLDTSKFQYAFRKMDRNIPFGIQIIISNDFYEEIKGIQRKGSSRDRNKTKSKLSELPIGISDSKDKKVGRLKNKIGKYSNFENEISIIIKFIESNIQVDNYCLVDNLINQVQQKYSFNMDTEETRILIEFIKERMEINAMFSKVNIEQLKTKGIIITDILLNDKSKVIIRK